MYSYMYVSLYYHNLLTDFVEKFDIGDFYRKVVGNFTFQPY
jgi:hypothetical protein